MLHTRRIYLVVLVLPGLILLHLLLQTSQVTISDSYRARFNKATKAGSAHAVDDRVGWQSDGHSSDTNAPNRDDIPGLGSSKSGGSPSWTDLGQRLGRLTGVAAGRKKKVGSNEDASAENGQSNNFKRSGGSIYEVRH
jgi:hypothetical protein